MLLQVSWEIKLGEFYINQKYFAKLIRKSWNTQKIIIAVESSLTNVPTVGEDLLRAFCKLFYLWFFISSDQWKNTVQQRFYVLFERHFYMKINCNFNAYRFSCQLVAFSLLFFHMEQKWRSIFKEVGGLVTKNVFVFLKASRAQLQRHTEFNRLL